MKYILLIFFTVSSFSISVFGQLKKETNSIKNTSVVVDEKFHSPTKAMLYEALLPGLGHIYNKKAWHLPITYTVFGATIFFIIDNTKKYRGLRDAYSDFYYYRRFLLQAPQYPLPMDEPKSQTFRNYLDANYHTYNKEQLENFYNALKYKKEVFKRYLDISYISLGVAYVLNILWATVDAHFYYYNVDDNLSLKIQPKMLVLENNERTIGVNLVLKF